MNALIFVAFLLRLVPYGFCIYLAWHKGYPRLTVYIALIS